MYVCICKATKMQLLLEQKSVENAAVSKAQTIKVSINANATLLVHMLQQYNAICINIRSDNKFTLFVCASNKLAETILLKL